MKRTDLQSQVSPEGQDMCHSEKKRTMAALNNTDRYMEGQYKIVGDSVSVEFKLVYTRFIDKFSQIRKLSGGIKHIDALVLDMIAATFSELKVTATPAQWDEVSAIIQAENLRYESAGSAGNSGKSDYFENGVMLYKVGKYPQACDYLKRVEPGHASFGEAMYLYGKALLAADEYNQALKVFKLAKDAGFKTKLIDDYLAQCAMVNKPADWYDTEEKRRNWWLSLDKPSVELILAVMNNLKINGKTFNSAYVYADADIQTLLKTTVLALNGTRVEDFQPLKVLTNVDVIIFENTKLKSDLGIQFFSRLRIVRTDSEIKTAGIKNLEKDHKIVLMKTKP
ncbi:MAG: hypothetical protein JNL57_11400 [Bacteroidetes bacterium]|nr:hypothetical protein [Bacteroidota bacterium]